MFFTKAGIRCEQMYWRLPNVWEGQVKEVLENSLIKNPFIVTRAPPWVTWWTSTANTTLFNYAYSFANGVGEPPLN